jgi:hypothetical protein
MHDPFVSIITPVYTLPRSPRRAGTSVWMLLYGAGQMVFYVDLLCSQHDWAQEG